MIYPETGDLWEYVPYKKLYLIMERTDELYQDYMVLDLDKNQVFQYSFENHMDLWRKLA